MNTRDELDVRALASVSGTTSAATSTIHKGEVQ